MIRYTVTNVRVNNVYSWEIIQNLIAAHHELNGIFRGHSSRVQKTAIEYTQINTLQIKTQIKWVWWLFSGDTYRWLSVSVCELLQCACYHQEGRGVGGGQTEIGASDLRFANIAIV